MNSTGAHYSLLTEASPRVEEFTPSKTSTPPKPRSSHAPLRIALVSKTNGCVGGASFFAENLGAWLLEAGHDVTHFCASPERDLRPHQRRIVCTGLAARMARHINWRARRLGLVEPLPWEYWSALRHAVDDFDVVHFHDLYMSISPRTLRATARRVPVVLTVHDSSTFTGGCLNPLGCERFRDECDHCPQKETLGRFDFTRQNLSAVRELARTPNMTYVFPSTWSKNQSAGSLRFGASPVLIPNGFNPRPYRFYQRDEARRLLGLPLDRKIVAVSSATLENRLKGIAFALNAIAANRELKPFVIIIGRPAPGIAELLQGVESMTTGFVEDREQLGRLYTAADLLLYPSLGDNLPITIQESMAAATPVVAFAVGGVPELIEHARTGWLVPSGDQGALTRCLRERLTLNDCAQIGPNARKHITENYSVAACVSRHVELYHAISDVRKVIPAR